MLPVFLAEICLLLCGITLSIVFAVRSRKLSAKTDRVLTILTASSFAIAVISTTLVLSGIHAPDPNLNGIPLFLFLSLLLVKLGTKAKSSRLYAAATVTSCVLVFFSTVLLFVPFVNAIFIDPLRNPFLPFYQPYYKNQDYSCYSKSAYGPPYFFIFEDHALYAKEVLRTGANGPLLGTIKDLRKTENGIEATIVEDQANGTLRDTSVILAGNPYLY